MVRTSLLTLEAYRRVPSGVPTRGGVIAWRRRTAAAQPAVPLSVTARCRVPLSSGQRTSLINGAANRSLPSGKTIADRFGRDERWGRLVKSAGTAGVFARSASLGATIVGDPLPVTKRKQADRGSWHVLS
jgi:hypothetical protein